MSETRGWSPKFATGLKEGHCTLFFVTVTVIVTVIMILAMFIFYFCLKHQDKHCIRHYDCDYDKKIRCKYGPFDPTSTDAVTWNQIRITI